MQGIRYQPQPRQRQVHETRANLIVISGGEGSGKSVVTSAEIAARYGTWDLVHLVAYKYESAHNEGDYLNEFLRNIGAVKSYSNPKSGKLHLVTRDGAIIESVSTEKEGPRAVTGTGKSPDIIAMIEAGKQSYAVFLACMTRISRKGGTLIVSGTIEQTEPWFPDLIQQCRGDNVLSAKVIIIPSWENRTLYPGGFDDAKIRALKATLPDALFKERLGGEPSPPEALIYKEFSFPTHVFDWCRFIPEHPVEVWIDPGYSGSFYAVEAVQFVPRAVTRSFRPDLPDASLTDVWVIDELYASHAIHEEVIAATKERAWWPNVRSGVGDVVMKTHPMAGEAPEQVWFKKAGIVLRGQHIEIADGIDRHRTFLKEPHTGAPRLFFNPQCKGATGEYTRWTRKQIAENLFGPPEKTNCDALKAIHYGLVDEFGFVDKDKPKPVTPKRVPAFAARRALQRIERVK